MSSSNKNTTSDSTRDSQSQSSSSGSAEIVATTVQKKYTTTGLISSINKTISQPIHTLAQVAGGVMDMLQGKMEISEGEEFVHTEMIPDDKPIVQPIEPEKVEEKKFSYEENINLLHEKVEKHRAEKTKREQEALVHSALLSEAKALEIDATNQEAEFILRERELEQQVKMNLKREMQFEAKRAAAHARALEAENERAKAEAEKLMFAKEREYARQLEEKHAMGQLRAEVLTKQHEMQAKELQLAEERLRFERNNAEILAVEIQGPSSLEIEVGVKPRFLPEKHKVVTVAPEATIASTLVSENYQVPPEEEIEDIFENLTIRSTASSASSETTTTAAPSHELQQQQPSTTTTGTAEKKQSETTVVAEQQKKNVKQKEKGKAHDKPKKTEEVDKSFAETKESDQKIKGKGTKTEHAQGLQQQHQQTATT